MAGYTMNPARIQQLLESARSRRVLVVGDVMLDEFVWGRVSRISPEAPVPVVEVQSESHYPGGAANVARNLAPFCRTSEICGLIGDDQGGRLLRNLLSNEGISTQALLAAPEMTTILKTRVVARQQQVVRVDRETKTPLSPEIRKRVLEAVFLRVSEVDGVILEDYGKGLLDQEMVAAICELAAAAGKIVAADPSVHNHLHWTGVSILKPNRIEAFALAGRPDPGATKNPLGDLPLLETAQTLLKDQRLSSLLITLGEHGMLLVEEGQPPCHIPTRAREVFDVSGAGDTAIALLTLILCAGGSLREAADISNYASGVVIGKLGTATLTPQELLAAASSG